MQFRMIRLEFVTDILNSAGERNILRMLYVPHRQNMSIKECKQKDVM